MADLLKSLTGGIARFALAWFLPVAVAVGLFWAACIPALARQGLLPALTGAHASGKAGRDPLTALGIAAFFTFAISIALAYASQLIYRILEGYHLPMPIDHRWTLRQRRRHARLISKKAVLERTQAGRQSKAYGLVIEILGLYPESPDRIMPTRLGNALRTLEGYALDRYGMDSQQFWYELVGTADERVVREMEEMRAQVDIFVAGVSVSLLLTLASLGVAGVSNDRIPPFLLAIGSIAVAPVAYRGAVRNMKDWANSVRALVNLGRLKVADSLGLLMPWRIEDEITMWRAMSAFAHYRDPAWRPWLNTFRKGSPDIDDRGHLVADIILSPSPERGSDGSPDEDPCV